MPTAEVNNPGDGQGSGRASARRRKYVTPSLARYGTLADLTRAGGTKNLNDSPGTGKGCGVGNNFTTSCINSDVRLKDDILPVKHLDNGISLYRFRYKGNDQRFVGVMAHEVANVVPDAVSRGADGYLRVDYKRLGLKFMTWEQWLRTNG